MHLIVSLIGSLTARPWDRCLIPSRIKNLFSFKSLLLALGPSLTPLWYVPEFLPQRKISRDLMLAIHHHLMAKLGINELPLSVPDLLHAVREVRV